VAALALSPVGVTRAYVNTSIYLYSSLGYIGYSVEPDTSVVVPIAPLHYRKADIVHTILINELDDLEQLERPWTELRRHGAHVTLVDTPLEPTEQAELERDLNAALDECGCHQGAIGLATFSVAAAALQIVTRRLERSGGSALHYAGRSVVRVGAAALAGAIVGKTIGLASGGVRFEAHRRRLRSRLEATG
jgi:hypothetical protein